MKRREARESFESAAQTMGPITPGLSLFAVTRGQFSMIDMIFHCLNEMGPAEVSVWTWAIADYEIEAMNGLMSQSKITGATLVIDHSAEKRNPEFINKWRDKFGETSVKICKNHAKIATVRTNTLRVLLRGSMNLNFNPRFEQLDVTEGGEDFDLVKRIEAELPVLPREYSNHEVESASKLNKAFELSTLKMFGGIKPWSK